MMQQYALSLGSNLGDRLEYLQRAVAALQKVVRVEKVSKVYQTQPMYVEDQPEFLNMAVIVSTDLAPRALLGELKAIEGQIGRSKTIRRGPREIDLDILLMKNRVYQDQALHIPHALYRERDFVLVPLAEIAGDWRDPHFGETISELKGLLEKNTVMEYDHEHDDNARAGI